MSTDTTDTTNTTVDRCIEHEVDSDDPLPANLREQEALAVQISEIQRRSGDREGVIELDVATVTSTPETDRWVLELAHPFVDNPRFELLKPVAGEDTRLTDVLEWYDVTGNHPMFLQTERVYVRHDGEEPVESKAWDLVRPPDVSPPLDRRLVRTGTRVLDRLHVNRLPRGPVLFWVLLFVGSVVGTTVGLVVASAIPIALFTIAGFLLFTVIALGVTEP